MVILKESFYITSLNERICFPGSSVGKESACSIGDLGLIPVSGRSPCRSKQQPTRVFLPGKSYRQAPGELQSTGMQKEDTTWWLNHGHSTLIVYAGKRAHQITEDRVTDWAPIFSSDQGLSRGLKSIAFHSFIQQLADPIVCKILLCMVGDTDIKIGQIHFLENLYGNISPTAEILENMILSYKHY